jgi:hypothetical protein
LGWHSLEHVGTGSNLLLYVVICSVCFSVFSYDVDACAAAATMLTLSSLTYDTDDVEVNFDTGLDF